MCYCYLLASTQNVLSQSIYITKEKSQKRTIKYICPYLVEHKLIYR